MFDFWFTKPALTPLQICYFKLKHLLITYFPFIAIYFPMAEEILLSFVPYIDRFLTLLQPYMAPLQPYYIRWLVFWNANEQEVKDVVFWIVIVYVLLTILSDLFSVGLFVRLSDAKASFVKSFFRYFKMIPGVQGKIDSELGKVIDEIESKLISKEARRLTGFRQLPAEGVADKQLKQHLSEYKALEKVDWKGGHVSGTVYHGGDKLSSMLAETYGMFIHANPLHPDVFPGVRKMEAEVVSMCLKMYNGPAGACGSITSGGTESILMACKAHRDYAYDIKGISEPEMHAPLDPKTLKVSLSAVKSLINYNTIMIVGSAPNYPHGVIDDIEGLSKIAKRWNVGLHVDCCLGSFILPFMNKAGFPTPPFDFSVAGVTSISCDTHKFGFAPKGSSVVMFRSKDLRRYQYSVAPNWPGGVYASPSIAGSRPGALIACCWAAMISTGESGYVEACRKIVSSARQIAEGIKKIKGIEVVGDPLAMVVAFKSDEMNVLSIADRMTEMGWNLNTLQFPPAVHICCTLPTTTKTEKFLGDLEAAAKHVRDNPDLKKGMGAIYGMAASIPDRSLIADIAKGYLDTLTK